MNTSAHNSSPNISVEHVLLDYPVTNEEIVSKRYIFHGDLGSGAYASVKRGSCSKTKATYAIKIISKSKTPKEYLKKFVPREVDALKRLAVFEHPFIAQMREFFETPHRIYLVTRLAPGGDLLAYINTRKYLSEDTSRRMTAQILCAVDHIHDQDIVHRDLKCENLLIAENDNILISDFGFATHQPRNRKLTTFCGSYAYAAPEILSGSSYNGKNTDVWSVGVILYAMLNGRLPYNDTKPKNILAKIKTTPLIMIRHVSMACEKFIRNVLTPNALERPTVCELLLDRWMESPRQNVLNMIPEHIQPSCFRVALNKWSSFRMSENSTEELKIFSSNESASPKVPIGIADEFVRKNRSVHSNNTSSTISERMKRKYRQIKTDLHTWASKKRKAVVPFKNVHKYDQHGKPTDDKEHAGSTRKTSIKYAVRDSTNPHINMKIFEIATNSHSQNKRSVSAIPPKDDSKNSKGSRAKSCLPESSKCEGGIRIDNDSCDQDARGHSNIKGNKGYNITNRAEVVSHPKLKGQRKRSNTSVKRIYDEDGRTVVCKSGGNGTVSAGHYPKSNKTSPDLKMSQNACFNYQSNKEVLNSRPKKGLPPLRRNSDTNDLLKRKEKVRQQLYEHNKMERKRRNTAYEKAMIYHNIQNVSNSKNYFNRDSQLNMFSGVDSSPHRRISNKMKAPIHLPSTNRYVDVRPPPSKIKDSKKKTKSTNLGTVIQNRLNFISIAD